MGCLISHLYNHFNTLGFVGDWQSNRCILMVEGWLINLLIPLIPLTIGIIFAAGSLYQKFRGMDQDLKDIKKQLNDIGESKSVHDQLIKSQQAAFSVYVEAFASLMSVLSKYDAIKKEDLIDILSKTSTDSINKTLQSIKGGTGNPISAEEARRLQKYVDRARANDTFTPDEARDFYDLSQRVSQDRSDDKGAWGILLLAAFIFALYFLSRKS